MDQGARILNGRYEVLDRLGEGAGGVVFRARDHRLDRLVAVKAMHPHRMGDLDSRRRMDREVRSVASLDHPHIVRMLDSGEEDGRFYAVMALVEGRTLSDVLATEGALPPVKVARIVAAIGDALAYAHERGLVHRDVKPGNVMLAADGDPVLLDFGLAVSQEITGLSETTGIDDHYAVGTPGYMSPEQVRGAPPSPATDQWSLAIVAYQLLTGTLPWAHQETLPAMLAEILLDEPQPITAHAPELPSAVWLVLSQAFEREPRLRYPAVDEFARELAAALRSGTPPSRRWRRALMPLRRSRGMAMLLSVLALAILFFTAAAAYGVAARRAVLSPEVEVRCEPLAPATDGADDVFLAEAATSALCRQLAWVKEGRQESVVHPAAGTGDRTRWRLLGALHARGGSVRLVVRAAYGPLPSVPLAESEGASPWAAVLALADAWLDETGGALAPAVAAVLRVPDARAGALTERISVAVYSGASVLELCAARGRYPRGGALDWFDVACPIWRARLEGVAPTGPPAPPQGERRADDLVHLALTVPRTDEPLGPLADRFRTAFESASGTEARWLYAYAVGRTLLADGRTSDGVGWLQKAVQLRPLDTLARMALTYEGAWPKGELRDRLLEYAAWAPERPEVWGTIAKLEDDVATARRAARRAWLLARGSARIALDHGELELRTHDRDAVEDAAAVGRELATGPAFGRVAADYLVARADLLRGRAARARDLLRGALGGAQELSQRRPGIRRSVGALVEIGRLTGRDEVTPLLATLLGTPVRALVDHPLAQSDFLRLAMFLCLRANPAGRGRCVEALDALDAIHDARVERPASIRSDCLRGARAYLTGRPDEAAEAWIRVALDRDVASADFASSCPIPAAFFDALGRPDLGRVLDRDGLDRGLLLGFETAHLREVRRLRREGRCAEARDLLRRVRRAWTRKPSTVSLPVLDELPALVQELTECRPAPLGDPGPAVPDARPGGAAERSASPGPQAPGSK